MTRYVFQTVKRKHTTRGMCVSCGRKCQRTDTAENTINPFNRNAAGMPKTRDEVALDVAAELEQLRLRPLFCAECKEARCVFVTSGNHCQRNPCSQCGGETQSPASPAA